MAQYFQQEEVRLGNQYLEDSALVSLLHRRVPAEELKKFEGDLIRFGARVAPGGDVIPAGRECELNPPQLYQVNAFGRRVDEIRVANGWKRLHGICAEEGLTAIGYERKFGEWSRLVQYVKCYLFSPSGNGYDCPLAMADGVARLIELNIQETPQDNRAFIQKAYEHLISRDPTKMWTSGQWMTEKIGGSDVQGTETMAKFDPTTGTHKLTGYKFFTSATTSEIAVTLGREQQRGPLSAFIINIRDEEGGLNNIVVHKLKQKLGTRAVPTAELELQGTPALLIGEAGKGVKVISAVLNITRIHNATANLGCARRALAIARDYASRRSVYGQLLSDNMLHLSTLADLEIEFRGLIHFLIDVLIKFGRTETNKSSPEEEVLLRVLIPLLKLYVAKRSLAMISECIEALGGTGYMEDSWLPFLLRDTQVGSIWEGTTNILSVDIWRPIARQNGLKIFVEAVKEVIRPKGVAVPTSTEWKAIFAAMETSLKDVVAFALACESNVNLQMSSARYFAFSLARIYITALLIEQALVSNSEIDLVCVQRHVANGLWIPRADDKTKLDFAFAMDVDAEDNPRGVGSHSHGQRRAKY